MGTTTTEDVKYKIFAHLDCESFQDGIYKDIMGILDSMTNDELMCFYNEFGNGTIHKMSEFDNVMSGHTPSKIADIVEDGVTWSRFYTYDNYFWINSEENTISSFGLVKQFIGENGMSKLIGSFLSAVIKNYFGVR